MQFVATWMDLELVILSEVSQKQKDKYHMTSFICTIYKETIQMNLLTKQKDSQTQKMNLWLLGGRIGGRDNKGGWGGHVHTAVFSVNNQQ